MKDFDTLINTDESDTIYSLVTDFFGSLKADTVYFELTHPAY